MTKIPLKSVLRLLPSSSPAALPRRRLSTTATTTSKLERIANELLSLNKLERHDYSILFRLKLNLSSPSAAPSLSAAASSGAVPKEEAKAEKTAFDVKLEKFDAAAKIKVIKEVRSFTELGLKEAKDLVEKTPVVVKKGVSKEEAEAIAEKLKALGATVSSN
ncbi:Large ribosomal subunit protein bL12c-like protein [Drosera capensis]